VSSPVLAQTRKGLCAARGPLPPPVVLVPTMGALHDGHRMLLRRARELAGHQGSVLVTIFVNPLQFGPSEDFERYPRTLEDDLIVCGEEGVDVVFAPSRAGMYPREQLITVDPGPMGDVLEGEFRPGFFRGVLTVVLKLFELTAPDMAVFGEKDAQQLALVRRLAGDLDLGIGITGVPTVRDPDGLATSSRNRYLSGPERASALALPRALAAGGQAAASGPQEVLKTAGAVLETAAHSEPPVVTDYLALVDPATFTPVPPGFTGEARLLVAARVGGTRLIDNMPVPLNGNPGEGQPRE
jgi:pantoate--beta-alanine ligase